MPSESYSFLDVAVLDQIRARFAAGEALVVLSTDLVQVIWANGPGADLLGYGDIEAALGASARLGAAARRQIAATRGFPAIGRDRPLLARLAIGVTSRAVPVLASEIALPDGEPAILLASPAEPGNETQTAQRVIGGFGEAGHFVALVDALAGIEASTPGFDALGISAESLAGFLARTSENRIVKRMIGGANGPLPAGLARLTDDPALHLLLVVDENRAGAANAGGSDQAAAAGADAHEEMDAAKPQTAESIQTDADEATELDAAGDERTAATEVEAEPEPAQPEHDTWYFASGDIDAGGSRQAEPQDVADDGAAGPTGPDVAAPPAVDETGPQPETENADPLAEREAETAEPEVLGAKAETAAASQDLVRPAIDRNSAPIRFVWRTDAQGKFSQISPEFVAAVGDDMANIVGRRFEELATTLGFDGNGEIAGLLDRRDTWSGRSVLWPVAGAGIRIPVDLAALPVYGRDRDFQGFRGFGVARGGDAVIDRKESPPAPAEAETPAGIAQGEDAPAPTRADPFQGETPALHIAPMPDRRSSDKIIRLAEHRQPANDKGLSSGERIAFQQIAERLKRESGATRGDQAADKPEQLADTADGAASEAPASGAFQDESIDRPTPVQGETGDAGSARVEESAEVVEPAHPAETAETSEPETAVVAADATGEAAESAVAKLPPEVFAEQPANPIPAVEKRPRPGMSLLDFAQWNHDDETDDLQDAESPGIEGEPTAGPEVGETAETAEAEIEASDEAVVDPSEATANDNGPADAEATVTQDNSAGLPAAEEAALAAPSSQPAAHGPDTAILEKLPVPVLVHSGDALHYANDEFLALTGYASVERLSAAGGIGALFAETYDDGNHPERRDSQMRLITAKGEEFPVDAFLQSVPWHGGKALLLVLRRVEEGAFGAAGQSPLIAELEARVAEMRTIIDTATDGVVLMTSDGTIRSISRPAEALFSFDSDEVAGKAFESLFAIESQRAARDYLNGLSDHGVASVLNDGREVIGRESRGRFIPLFMTIGKLPGDSGYCAVVRDITQWKRAEEDLTQARATAERSSSQKTDFLARVSHEIRTPLNAIIGFSELMIDERFGPVTNDRYRDYLRDINRSGNHVLDLVNDLLDISKIEAGQQEMDYEAVSLNDALAETVAMMQPQANRERVIIRSSFASKLPDVVADLRSVRQIALNILSNAVRYTQAGGQVIVSTAYEAAGDIVMRVRDTGIGMTQAEIEQAMKPFKQINSLKRARGDGTGLGLPLTKAMVEANRAKFVIHSTPGEGTLVEVTFPSTRVLAD